MTFYLLELFGDSVNIRIIEVLLQNLLKENPKTGFIWMNISQMAEVAQVAKSSTKRIVDKLLDRNFIIEKPIQTHAQSPPRLVRLNSDKQAINELVFFYRKARGFL